MNYEQMLSYLDTYNDRELFYQRYREKKKSPKEAARFLASLDPQLLQKRGLVLPEYTDPDTVPVQDDSRFSLSPAPDDERTPSPIPGSERASSPTSGSGHTSSPASGSERTPSPAPDDERTLSPASNGRDILLSRLDRYAPPLPHTHTFFEILYVLRGHCTHHVFYREETLAEGDLCLLSPSMTHAVDIAGDSLVLDICIRRENIANIFYPVLRGQNPISSFLKNSIYIKNYATYLTFHTGGDPELQMQLLDMYMERHFQDDAYSDSVIGSMMALFFARMLRKYGGSAESPAETALRADAMRLLEYILQDYRTITLSELARKLNYSVPYCSKYIKDTTGYTFQQLLQKTRFQIAESYLLTSPLSVQKISALLGYENPENFIRAFKKAYGTSPAKFRAQH